MNSRSTFRRRNKYGAVKVEADGFTFDSKAEHARYQQLKLLQKAGKIGHITVHPRYEINPWGERICIVELDFSYPDWETHLVVIEDVKGVDTALSRLKRKLVEGQHGFQVSVIKNQ